MSDRTPKISAAEYRKLKGLDTANAVPKPKNKYNARSTIVDGLHFPSKLEAAVWCQLKLQYGSLAVWRYPSVKLPGGVMWKIDFEVIPFGGPVIGGPLPQHDKAEYHEAKGVETADYKVKLKLYKEFGDRPLHIWKGSAAKPFISETVIPKTLGDK